MKKLTIFHDPRCGMCAKFSTWLTAQPRWVAVEFVDWASDEAARRLPGIREMGAGKDVVVLADDGAWWQGDAAWLTCLWATREYRPWSWRLASPSMRPFLRRAVALLSENRLALSRLLRLSGDAGVAEAIDEVPGGGCVDGSCEVR
jgi:predicted DCC family thiol-disulfide oxidoreductase YuxK